MKGVADGFPRVTIGLQQQMGMNQHGHDRQAICVQISAYRAGLVTATTSKQSRGTARQTKLSMSRPSRGALWDKRTRHGQGFLSAGTELFERDFMSRSEVFKMPTCSSMAAWVATSKVLQLRTSPAALYARLESSTMWRRSSCCRMASRCTKRTVPAGHGHLPLQQLSWHKRPTARSGG